MTEFSPFLRSVSWPNSMEICSPLEHGSLGSLAKENGLESEHSIFGQNRQRKSVPKLEEK